MTEYATLDLEPNPRWTASHIHPSVSLSDLGPWFDSFGIDLFGATTYQVTAEMVELAEGLTLNTPNLGILQERDLPAPWGFCWFDKPIPRPAIEDNGRPPLLVHAVSWSSVPAMPVLFADLPGGVSAQTTVPAVRIRKWGYNDDPNVFPRPLHLMGQNTVLMHDGIQTDMPDIHLIHMVWILMGMEIVSTDVEEVGRGTRRRAENLRHQEVHVVRLRRTARRDTGAPRPVDWSCTWLVRGHPRAAPHGGTFADGRESTLVKPYIKGPEGLPFRASDLLYKLSR
jgi:hypothetical protein